MKKFFKDNTLKYQTLTKSAAKLFFNIPDNIIDSVIEKEKFLVIYSYGNNEYNVQITFNILPNNDNNYYLVLIFDKNNDLFMYFNYLSNTKYPPVWNREFGNIDYTDFLGIQKKVNETLSLNKKSIIEYDFSLKNRSHYFTKETPEEIEKLLKEGQSYHIINIFAEKKIELSEISRKIIGI